MTCRLRAHGGCSFWCRRFKNGLGGGHCRAAHPPGLAIPRTTGLRDRAFPMEPNTSGKRQEESIGKSPLAMDSFARTMQSHQMRTNRIAKKLASLAGVPIPKGSFLSELQRKCCHGKYRVDAKKMNPYEKGGNYPMEDVLVTESMEWRRKKMNPRRKGGNYPMEDVLSLLYKTPTSQHSKNHSANIVIRTNNAPWTILLAELKNVCHCGSATA
jgi:hypothetical protein